MSVLLQDSVASIEPSIDAVGYRLPCASIPTVHTRRMIAMWCICLSAGALAMSVLVIGWGVVGVMYDHSPEAVFLRASMIVAPIAFALLLGFARFDRRTDQIVRRNKVMS